MTSKSHAIEQMRWARKLAAREERERMIGCDYAAVLTYDGRAFSGYARQPDRVTVEGVVRQALTPLIPGFRRLAVAGRTDRGVSAVAQVISFRGDTRQPVHELAAALDQVAPGALACRNLVYAPRRFHAQFWAHDRYYGYFHPAQAHEIERVHDINRQLRQLIGSRCWYAFSRETPEGQNTIRELYFAGCRPVHLEHTQALLFEFRASGFLRRMVRVIVATALQHGRKGEPEDALLRLSEARDRRLTAQPAPPEYLYFMGVSYPGWCVG